MKVKQNLISNSEVKVKRNALNPIEISVLNGYCLTASFKMVSGKLNISQIQTKRALQSALLKIKANPTLIEQWVDDPFIKVIRTSEEARLQDFINSSLSEHDFPTNLYNCLLRMHCETMLDVLALPARKIKSQKGLGEKSFTFLTELLRKNNCLHLLKLD